MTDNTQPATGLTAALNHAKTYDTASQNAAVAPCPIKDNLIYIVPTRYAVSEQWVKYPTLLTPFLNTAEAAVRKLRAGYLYIWQPTSKLRQFTVTDQGNFIEQINYTKNPQKQGGKHGITVNGDEDLYLIFTEGVPLTEAKFNELNESANLRRLIMRKINAQKLSYGLAQLHTVPLDDTANVMAELQPTNERKQQAADFYKQYPNYPDLSKYSSDYARHIGEQDQSIKQYIANQATVNRWSEQEQHTKEQELRAVLNDYPKSEVNRLGEWSACKWEAAAAIKQWITSLNNEAQATASELQRDIASVVKQKNSEANQQQGEAKEQLQQQSLDAMARWNHYRTNFYGYLVVLDDAIGLMQDIESIQLHEAARHEQWINYNSVRTTIAGFIRNLTTTNPNELKSRLAYRFKGQFEPADEQAQQIATLQQQIDQRHQQYVAAYRAYLKASPNVQMQLPYHDAIQHYKKGLPYQERVEPKGNTLDQDVALITAPTQAYIPADIFDQLWDDVSLYFYQKRQNVTGSNAGAEVNQRIDTAAVNYWLDQAIPSYQKHLDKTHENIIADRKTLISPVYQQITWYIDGTLEEHRATLDDIAYTCFMQQTASPQGVEQMVNVINTEKGAEIFSLLISRGISIMENSLNYGARLQEFLSALSSESTTAASTMINLLSDSMNPSVASVFTKPKLQQTLASMEQAAQGKWGEVMRSFSTAIINLTVGLLAAPVDAVTHSVAGVYNKGSNGLVSLEAIPVRTLPSLIMLWFSDKFALEVNNGKLQVTGSKAKVVEAGIKEFVREAPKANPTLQANNQMLNAYKQAGKVGGIIPVVMAFINGLNAALYFADSLENPNRTEQQIAEARSAYLYAGSAFTGLLASGYGYYLKKIKLDKIALTSMHGFYFTALGGVTGAFGFAGALYDAKSLSIQMASSGSNVDPALTYRYYAANAQMVLYGAQAAIGAGLALATFAGVISGATAIGVFMLCMGPLAWLLLAAGAFYLWAWSQQENPLQHFLSGCCWGTRPKYPNPTPEQLVEDLAELIKLLFKPTLIGQYDLAQKPNVQAKHFRDASYGEVYNRLNQLAIYLPAAEPNAEIAIRLKAKYEKHKQANPIENITDTWLRRVKPQWIPYELGQGIVLNAELDILEIEQAEAHIHYTNPIITMYNKQIAQIAQHLQVEDYYYTIESSGVEEIIPPKKCTYLTARDPLVTLAAQQLTPKV